MLQELRNSECLHAVGQGALAVECKTDDIEVLNILKDLNHKETVLSVIAERALMRTMVSIEVTLSSKVSQIKFLFLGGWVFSPIGSLCSSTA